MEPLLSHTPTRQSRPPDHCREPGSGPGMRVFGDDDTPALC